MPKEFMAVHRDYGFMDEGKDDEIKQGVFSDIGSFAGSAVSWTEGAGETIGKGAKSFGETLFGVVSAPFTFLYNSSQFLFFVFIAAIVFAIARFGYNIYKNYQQTQTSQAIAKLAKQSNVASIQ